MRVCSQHFGVQKRSVSILVIDGSVRSIVVPGYHSS